MIQSSPRGCPPPNYAQIRLLSQSFRHLPLLKAKAQALPHSFLRVGMSMPVKRKYTNATFTKRVDHQAGRHRPARGMREPAICKDCRSVYVNRRWTSGNSALLSELSQPSQPPKMTIC